MNRLLTICLLFLAMASAAVAQQELPFTTLDWNTLRIDSVLPVYTEVVPLESDYRTHSYTVSLRYPEYEALDSREAEVAARYDNLIGEEIVPETFVGIERGRGLLDITFVPIRRQNGKYEKLTSAQIVINVTGNGRQNARLQAGKKDRYAAQSRLSEGKWVKIGITEDGLYQLSRAMLKKQGFSKPENVHLYGYGGHLLPELVTPVSHHDDLVEVPLYYNQATDSWVFWGNGLVHWKEDTRIVNTYARTAYYFLTEEDAPSKMETLAASEATPEQTVTTTRGHSLYEKDEFAWHPIGRHLFDAEDYAHTNSHTYSLTGTDVAGNGKVTVVFTGSSNTTNTVNVTINGTAAGTIGIEPIGDYIFATSGMKTCDVENASDKVTVALRSKQSLSAHLDYIAYSYDRRLSCQNADGYVGFSGTASGTTEFRITGQNVKVIRTGAVGTPDMLVSGRQEGTTYSINVDNGRQHFVAFNTAKAFPEPTVAGAVAPQNLHSLADVDMVIIIPASGKLQRQAQRLADAHLQYDSLRVAIVRADQVYNEFSSGTPDPTAIRLFMKMLYDKAETADDAPRYLLLFGDGAWDNRMLSTAWRNSSPDDYLLCYESENSFSGTKSYVMEDYFGLLDDGEGANPIREKSDIGIGRFPVTTDAKAKVMVDKSIAFMSGSNAGVWKNQIYILGDDGDKQEHMRYANYVADNIYRDNPELEVRKVMWDAYTRVSSTNNNTYPEVTNIIHKAMREGALVMNYTGHAGPAAFSHEYVFQREDFENSKSTKLPLWVTCACDVMPFDAHTTNNGEAAVLNPAGGAMAFYGTTRTVYASQNYNMNRFFMQYVLGQTSGRRNRIGDAIRMAKNSIISNNIEVGYYENKLQYALLGDPAITLGAPLQRVVVDSINGNKADGRSIPLKAGERVRLHGHIEQADGTLMTGFNGVIHTRLFDSKETVVCHNNLGETDNEGNSLTPFTFTSQDSKLYESQDSVQGGLFHEEFIIPIDIKFSNKDGRLVFYAVSEGGIQEAIGYNEDIPIGGMVESTDFDVDGPEIYAYLNSEDFQNGDVVNATPFFVAKLHDASGISASGNGIGHDLTLCIDGRGSQTYVINEGYVHEFGDFTRGTASYSIPTLTPGPHRLTFRAWDVLNNTSETSLDFVVDNGLPTSILRLTASQNPARVSTTFLLSYDLPGSNCDFVFEVFDFSGRTVWRHEENSSNESGICSVNWNLTNGAGAKVGSGIYLYRCQVRCGESKWTTKTEKIIVQNNK